MKKYLNKTPEGTRDLLFEECVARRAVEERLSTLFLSYGYNQVVTPSVEYYQVFSRGSSGLRQEDMYKLTDANGRLIVLRPDNTLPIARVVSGRLKEAPLPIRLFYCQKIFRRHMLMAGHSDECEQCGVELIGAGGLRADLEILTLAVRALDAVGVPGFKLEIGHAGFYNALCDLLDVDEDLRVDINELIEKKNYAALGDLLDTLPESEAVAALRRLPRLFGGPEILDEAAGLCASQRAQDSLAYLRRICAAVQKMGLGDSVTVDLGLVHRNNYYTGLVFRGYIPGSGATVLSGGRYDRLLGEFGEPHPATGFGVEVDELYKALLDSDGAPAVRVPDALVFGVDGYELEALERLGELTGSGLVCENFTGSSRAEAIRYAAAHGIPKTYCLSSGGWEEIDTAQEVQA